MLKTPTPNLIRSAQMRSERKDLGETATWEYSSSQENPPLLLVHGFRGDHHGLEAIAGAMPDFRIFIPDLPGYGKTNPLESKHSLENYAKWLIELYKGLPEGTAVLGHSFGSLVVAKALELGLEANSVVLLNPITTRANDQNDFANRLARWFYKITQSTGALGSAALRSPVIVRGMSIVMATTKNLRLRSFIHSQHARFFSSYIIDRVAWEGFEAASSANVLDYTSAINARLLLIAGDLDKIAPLSGQIRLQSELADSRLEVIERVGHLTHYETPEQVASLVREFLVKG